MNKSATNHTSMTLDEASKFLNIKQPVLQTLAEQGRVPGRKIRNKWQFSRNRLEKWMLNGREPEIALLQQAGVCKDDPDLLKILDDIYKARGRPEREED